jgi:ATPase subunit of ABC transporter with duplicated ATPase domains
VPAINVKIPTLTGDIFLSVEPGRSIVFIGANGGGKTRLGAYIEEQLRGAEQRVQRIAAQRAIKLKARVDVAAEQPMRSKEALRGRAKGP